MFTFQLITLRAVLRSQKLLTNAIFPLLPSKPICSHFRCCKRRKARDSLASGLRQCKFMSELSCFWLCWNILLFISLVAKYLGLFQIITRQEFAVNLKQVIAYTLSREVFKKKASIQSCTAAAIAEQLAMQNTFLLLPDNVTEKYSRPPVPPGF